MRYHVPSMREIAETEWNGFNVVSTFSGGGGSCLGYEMAGYRVLWASEFVEEAQRTYRANHPGTYLDTRDIRDVRPEDILERTGLERGELDLFDGSPPCCAFSTAGAREKHWGQRRGYSDGKVQVVDDLFFEYVRILDGLKPKTFVAENVSGLVKGSAKGYFIEIMRAMKGCGYRVKAALVDASRLGVPQRRVRTIFVGVRDDLGMDPVFPRPRDGYVSIRDALDGLENDERQAEWLERETKRYAVYREMLKMDKNPSRTQKSKRYLSLVRDPYNRACSTVCQTSSLSAASVIHPLHDRRFTIPELKRIMSVPDDFVLTGTYEQQYERLGRMVPPLMMMAISETIRDEVLCETR